MSVMTILTTYPILALAIALILGLLSLWAKKRRKQLFIVASLWMLYGFYEYLNKINVLCSGKCNIRVDLLIIYPILLIATLFAIASVVKQRYTQQDE